MAEELTESIPARVRRALVDAIRPYLSSDDLVDLIEALRTSHGDQAAEKVARAVAENLSVLDREGQQYYSEGVRLAYEEQRRELLSNARNFAEEVLATVPDDWFARVVLAGRDAAIEAGFEALNPSGAAEGFDSTVEGLLQRNGVPYRIEGTELVRIGDPTVATQAIQPALAVIDDPRLQDARRHFEGALADLRRGDPEDAVDEARQAIEAVLLAYIADRNHELPSRHQPDALFEAAVSAGLPREAQELVLGAARYRGRTRAGHAGRPPVPQGDAEAVIGSAAAAIVFVGHRLG
jgi:HEPN domain-containing protein